ncbi:MAG: hypothetical protein HYT07_01520 [Candidatus Levybacteria bacterium]|nr:hypothetical protein [Candidatus Levybacteria bacterium]
MKEIRGGEFNPNEQSFNGSLENLKGALAKPIHEFRTSLQEQARNLHEEAEIKTTGFFRRKKSLLVKWSSRDYELGLSYSSILKMPYPQPIDESTPLESIRISSYESNVKSSGDSDAKPVGILSKFNNDGIRLQIMWREDMPSILEKILSRNNALLGLIEKLNNNGIYSRSASRESNFWGGGNKRTMGVFISEKSAGIYFISNAKTHSYDHTPIYFLDEEVEEFIYDYSDFDKSPGTPDKFSMAEFEQVTRDLLGVATYATKPTSA